MNHLDRPLGYGCKPQPLTKEEIKNRLRKWAMYGEAHVDNLWSEAANYIEELERKVNDLGKNGERPVLQPTSSQDVQRDDG
jgi:hypothetical protein